MYIQFSTLSLSLSHTRYRSNLKNGNVRGNVTKGSSNEAIWLSHRKLSSHSSLSRFRRNIYSSLELGRLFSSDFDIPRWDRYIRRSLVHVSFSLPSLFVDYTVVHHTNSDRHFIISSLWFCHLRTVIFPRRNHIKISFLSLVFFFSFSLTTNRILVKDSLETWQEECRRKIISNLLAPIRARFRCLRYLMQVDLI